MNSPNQLADLVNGRAIGLAEIPEMAVEDFREAILFGVESGQRVSSFFGAPADQPDAVRLYVVLADDRQARLRLAKTTIHPDNFESMTPDCPQVHLFEREIAEQFGIKFDGHPWFK